MDDFSPEAVAQQVKPLKELLDLRTKLADLRGTLQGNDKLDEILQATLGDEDKMKRAEGRSWALREADNGQSARRRRRPATAQSTELGLLDQIVEDGRVGGKDAAAKERGKDMVKQFVSEVLEGSITMSRDTEAMINARIAQIDHLISLQLNEIMHHAEFQKLEAHVARAQVSARQHRDRRRSSRSRSSTSRRRSCCATCSARPSSTRARCSRRSTRRSTASSAARRSARSLGDYEFDKSGQDIELLEKISQRGRRGARAVPDGGVAEHVQPRELHAARCSRATSARSSTPPSTPSGRRSGRARIRATSR